MMKPNLFKAIDRIGDRLTARLDWETTSGLPWDDLQPYLVAAPGKLSREVQDPGNPSQSLVAWHRNDAMTILESQEIPAHREPMEIDQDACILHRLNVIKIGIDLADSIGFIPLPTKSGRDFYHIGMVQVPNRAVVDVFLLIPTTPGSAKLTALRLAATRNGKDTMILLPSARWREILPDLPLSFEVRTLAEFLQSEENDSLIAVAADASPQKKTKIQRPAKSLEVRTGDKWSDLIATFDPGSRMLELKIQARRLSVCVWDTRKNKPTNDTLILNLLLREKTPSWIVTKFPEKAQDAMRQAFFRFQKELAKLAPVPDGKPFWYEPATKTHYPRFILKRKPSV
jgi:hypothetical protein